MKLTKAQREALQNIADWSKGGSPFYKEQASRTRYAVRENVLRALEKAELIQSQRPYAGSYYTVTLTEAGRRALEDGK